MVNLTTHEPKFIAEKKRYEGLQKNVKRRVIMNF